MRGLVLMSGLVWLWWGIELDLYPYFTEKVQQGLIWRFLAQELPEGETSTACPTFNFETHAGTFYDVLLPQIRQSNFAQVMCCVVTTRRWNAERGEYLFCDPYARRGIPRNTKMKVKIQLKHPKEW